MRTFLLSGCLAVLACTACFDEAPTDFAECSFARNTFVCSSETIRLLAWSL